MVWPCLYTSARGLTVGHYSFTYGRVEARIRIPYGQSIWPAFWLLGANYREAVRPTCGEIDCMEIDGGNLSTLYGTVHGPGSSGPCAITKTYKLPAGPDFSNDYHIYAVEWEPNQIRWYVDGNLYSTVSTDQFSKDTPWVFDHPFILLLNIAVGGDFPGAPDSSTQFLQMMYVDYLRVYQHQ
jgi:beta-glucanase (GH16 family)